MSSGEQNSYYEQENGFRIDPWDIQETYSKQLNSMTDEQKAILLQQASQDELHEAEAIARQMYAGASDETITKRMLYGSEGDCRYPVDADYASFLDDLDETEEEEEDNAKHREGSTMDERHAGDENSGGGGDTKTMLDMDEHSAKLLRRILDLGREREEQVFGENPNHNQQIHEVDDKESPLYMQSGELPEDVKKHKSSRDTVVPKEKLDQFIPPSARDGADGRPGYDATNMEELFKQLQEDTKAPSVISNTNGAEDADQRFRELLAAVQRSEQDNPGSFPEHVFGTNSERNDNDGSTTEWEKRLEEKLFRDKDFRQFRDTFISAISSESGKKEQTGSS